MLGLTVFYLYEMLFMVPGRADAFWLQVLQLVRPGNWLMLSLPVLLVGLNWGLEAQKWVLLAKPLEPLSFWTAFQSVVAGVTLGMITPNRVGDYAARMFLLKNNHRIKAIGGIFLGRMCQMHSTAVFGSLGLMYFIGVRFFVAYPYVVSSAVLMVLFLNALFTLFLYNTGLLVPLVNNIKVLRPVLPALWMLQRYPATLITQVLWLSAMRYLVFAGQFVLLLYAVRIALPVGAALAGASATLLVKSLLPSFNFLSDIGVRELSAIHFFGLLGQDETKVLAASLCLWLINIALPALVGLAVVFKFRIKKLG